MQGEGLKALIRWHAGATKKLKKQRIANAPSPQAVEV